MNSGVIDFTLRRLLGLALKNPEVIELLNDEDIDVRYDFDRLHEGGQDRYWAPARELGYELCFNEHQSLRTVFCYVAATEKFKPIDTSIIGVPIYRSFEAAKHGAQAQGLSYVTPDVRKYRDMAGRYVRVNEPDCAVHYEFKGGELRLITLMLDPP